MPRTARISLWLAGFIWLAGASAAEPFRPGKFAAFEQIAITEIASNKCPGFVAWVEHGTNIYRHTAGERQVTPAHEKMTPGTIFDVASLTKVMATAPAIMLLKERGRLKLEDAVTNYWPEFGQHGKTNITLKHLLTHVSGFRPGLGGPAGLTNYESAMHCVEIEKPQNAPGVVFQYSDINFIALGEIVRRVSGVPLNEFVAREIYGPLKMTETRYLPPKEWLPRIAPTEKLGDTVLRGEVHDPTARHMGGVAGHAGVFSTVSDTARLCRMFLNEGELDGVRIFKSETVQEMIVNHTEPPVLARRGYGWDIESDYSRPRGKWFSLFSYGHTGFTGTSLWIDPATRTFVIFFSNRVHPTRDGDVRVLQRSLSTLAAEALPEYDFGGAAK